MIPDALVLSILLEALLSSCRLAEEGGTTTELWFASDWKGLVIPQPPDIPTSKVGTGAPPHCCRDPVFCRERKDPLAHILLLGNHHHPETRSLFPAGFQIRIQSSQSVYFYVLRTWLLIYVCSLNLWSVPRIIYPRYFPAPSVVMIALHRVDFSSILYISWKMVH